MEQISLKRIRRMTRAECKIQKNIFIIMGILLGAGSVLTGLGISSKKSDAELFLGICLLYGTIFVGFILCLNLFRDMNSSQLADVKLALPVSAVERYISKILAMFWIQLLPTFVAGIFSFAFSYVMLLIRGQRPNILKQLPHEFCMAAVSTVVVVLFTNAIVIFCCVSCGTFAESCYFSMILLFCITAIPLFFGQYLIESFSGIWKGTFFFPYWTYTSVISMAEKDTIWTWPTWISILISCIVFGISGFLYKKRDGQGIGNPFVFRFTKNIFMFLGAFTLLIGFSGLGNEKVGCILTFIVYFIIDLIIKRGKINIREILKSVVSFALIFVIFVGISTAAYFTNGFGYSKFVPKMKKDETCRLYCEVFEPESEEDTKLDFSLYRGAITDAERKGILNFVQNIRSYEPKTLKTCYDRIVYNDISKIKKENYRIYIAFMPKKKANYVIYQCQFYLTKEKAQELEDEIEKYKTSKKE